jgi:hypothetical protein
MTDRNFPYVARMIWVGQGGDVVLIARDQSTGLPNNAGGAGPAVTLKNVPSGTVLNIMTRQVLATGTTAAFIVGGR